MSSSSNPIEKFDALHTTSDFIFLVYYRGHWCPFCISYLREFAALTPTIAGAHGQPLIVTAEPEPHLPATRSATGYSGDAIVDPSHVLAKELKRRGWLDVAVTQRKGYAEGVAQPAVLVVRRDGMVLESWGIVPGVMNIGGATDRPNLREIWENAEAKMNGKSVRHTKYSTKGILGLLREKIFGK